jgi:hypothetical protein
MQAAGIGIGIGSDARQAFGHPVGVRILALRVRGDQQANDTLGGFRISLPLY